MKIKNISKFAETLTSGKWPKHEQVNLYGFNITLDDLTILFEALQSEQCPVNLDVYLANNNLCPKAAKIISKSLMSGKLKNGLKLNLSSNKLGDLGVSFIAEGLKSGNSPQKLFIDLGCNLITDTGIRDIAQAFESGKSPTDLKLNFEWNKIGKKSAQLIAKAIKSGKCSLGLNLNLKCTEITSVEITEIIDAIIPGIAPYNLKLSGGFDVHCECKLDNKLIENNEFYINSIQSIIYTLLMGNINGSIFLPDEMVYKIGSFMMGPTGYVEQCMTAIDNQYEDVHLNTETTNKVTDSNTSSSFFAQSSAENINSEKQVSKTANIENPIYLSK